MMAFIIARAGTITRYDWEDGGGMELGLVLIELIIIIGRDGLCV